MIIIIIFLGFVNKNLNIQFLLKFYRFSKLLYKIGLDLSLIHILCMSEIIFAPIWSLILFDERFTQTAFIGACVMIFALMLNVYMDYKIKTS